jgi:hypothetical protein
MNFADTVRSARVILTEGALIERLRRDPAVRLDPRVAAGAPPADVPLAASKRKTPSIAEDSQLSRQGCK